MMGRRMDVARRELDTFKLASYIARYPSIIVYALYNNVNLQSIAFCLPFPS